MLYIFLILMYVESEVSQPYLKVTVNIVKVNK